MTTLLVKDLPAAETLNHKAMSAVRGGMYAGFAPSWMALYAPVSSVSKSIEASQFVGQEQVTNVVNGGNAAFVDHLKANVTVSQFGQNNITQY